MSDTSFTLLRTSEPKDAIVTIEVEIPAQTLEKHRATALKHHARELKLPGFREGHVPEHVAEPYLDQGHILEDAAERALQNSYKEICAQAGVAPISSPRVKIKNLAKGSALLAEISVAVRPEVSLPDYKRIAKKIREEQKPVVVTDQEVQEFMDSIHASQKKTGTEGDMSDEELAKRVRETIEGEKKLAWKQEFMTALQKELVKESKTIAPELLVEDEFQLNVGRIQDSLKGMGMRVEDYLKKMGKSEKDFIQESRDSLEEQIKAKFILAQIAQKEGIAPDEKDVQAELGRAYLQYPHTSKERVEEFVREALVYRCVIEFLEKEPS